MNEPNERRKARLEREIRGGKDDGGFIASIGMIAIVLVVGTMVLGLGPREGKEVVLQQYATVAR